MNVENWGEEKGRNIEMNKQQQPDSGTNDTSAHCPRVYNFFQSSRPHSSREKCDKNFNVKNWRERKMRNKGTSKQQQPESGVHDTSAHCPRVYQVSIF